MQQDKFIEVIQKIVKNMLEKMGFLTHEWHLGKVAVVNINGTVDVFIDGSSVVTPSVPTNPHIAFVANDYVWVHFVNRNPNNLFIPYKRYGTVDSSGGGADTILIMTTAEAEAKIDWIENQLVIITDA